MRDANIRNDADGRLPILLRMLRLRGEVAAEAWRLLRLLLLWFGPLPADSGRALRRGRTCIMLRLMIT